MTGRRRSPALGLLVIASLLTACTADASPALSADAPQPAPTSTGGAARDDEPATWKAAARLPDGGISTDGFDRFVNALEPPPEDAVEVALLLFGFADADVDHVESEASGTAGTRVVLLTDVEDDDSVASQRHQATVLRDRDGRWTVTAASWGQACRAGRGHQDYSAEPCV